MIAAGNLSAETTIRFGSTTSDVQVRYSGSDPWREVRFGERLGPGASVRVGPYAECDLVVGEPGNNVRLEAGTVLTIKELEPDGDLYLETGGLFASMKRLKKGSRFRVATPTAIASVRGTAWHQTLTRISVFEGQVQVLPVTAAVESSGLDLAAGLSVEISQEGELGEPGPIPTEETSEWTEVQEEIAQEEPSEAPGSE